MYAFIVFPFLTVGLLLRNSGGGGKRNCIAYTATPFRIIVGIILNVGFFPD